MPELRPGDIVIMGNLPAHKGSRVEAQSTSVAVDLAGAVAIGVVRRDVGVVDEQGPPMLLQPGSARGRGHSPGAMASVQLTIDVNRPAL